MRCSIAIFLFVCCCPFTAISSAPQGNPRAEFRYTFSFSPHPDTDQRKVNMVLRMLAEGSGRLRAFVSYDYLAEMQVVDTMHRDGRKMVAVVPLDVSLQGDLHYKHFSLASLLMPDRADFRMVLHGSSGEELESWQYRGMEMPVPGEQWIMAEPDRYYGPKDRIVRFTDVRLYYDDLTMQRISRWREALATYYGAPPILDEVRDLINGLDPYNPRRLLLDEFRLCEAEALLGDVRYAPFHAWDNVVSVDPEGVLSGYFALKREVAELRTAFNTSVIAIDSLYYHAGLDVAAGYSYYAARDMFLAAVEYNPFHIPSHLALVRADHEQEMPVPALHRLSNVFSVMVPGMALREEAHALAGNVLSVFFDAARELMAEGRHTSSLDTLRHVQEFCKATEDAFPCPRQLPALLSGSHYGVYASYLTVARRALQNDDIPFARMFVQNALDYHYRWPEYVSGPDEAHALLFRVFTRGRTLAELARLFGEPAGAERYLSQVVQIAAEHPGLFRYVMDRGDEGLLGEGVLNYAVAGMPENSIHMLRRLQELGVRSSSLSYHQRVAGEYAARSVSRQNPEKDPQVVVRELTEGDPWFQIFEHSFIEAW